MKNFKTLTKKLSPSITVMLCLFLAVVLALSSFIVNGISGLEFVSADTTQNSDFWTNTNLKEWKSGTEQVPTNGTYGSTITLPNADGDYRWVITDPTGKPVTPEAGTTTFKAEYLGYYKATLQVKDASGNYKDLNDFFIKITAKEDLYIVVDNNGADIPTFIASGQKIQLPNAKVYFDNEDGERVPIENSENVIKIEVVGPKAVNLAADKSFTPAVDGHGTYYVRYSYENVGGTPNNGNGKHVLSKDYTIRVQQGFEDNSSPQLSVGTIASEYSVKTAVTLPTATATDNFDENVRIMMQVNAPNGEIIRTAELETYTDANGKEYTFVKDYTSTEVVFDNTYSKSLTFYPEIPGKYQVYYWAFDDSGNGLNNKDTSFVDYSKLSNAVSPILSEFTVADRAAPTMLFTKAQVAQIPNTWSRTLEEASNSNLSVTFPVPLVIDNLDGSTEDYATKNGNDWEIKPKEDRKIKVSLRIENPGRTDSLLYIDDIYDSTIANNIFFTGDATKVWNDGVGEWKFSGIEDQDRITTGEYTVTYTVRDSSSRSTTTNGTYKINLTLDDASEFTSKPVDIVVDRYQKNVKLNADQEAEFKFPTFSAIDRNNKDQRVETSVTYQMLDGSGAEITNATGELTGDVTLTNKSGDKDKKGYVYLQSAAQMKIIIKAESNYNKQAADSVLAVNILDPSASISSNIGFGIAAEDRYTVISPNTNDGLENLIQNEKVELGDFVFNINNYADTFAGVTMIIRNEQGTIVNDSNTVATYVLETTTVSTHTTKIRVEDVKFIPRSGGTFTITFVINTLNNAVAVFSDTLVVEAVSGGGFIDHFAVAIDPSMEVYQTYTLPEFSSEEQPDAPMYRKVAGPVATIAGSEFTPLSSSASYAIELGIMLNSNTSGSPASYDKPIARGGTTTVFTGKTEAPTITIVKPMDFYKLKYSQSAINAAETPAAKKALEESMIFYLPEIVAESTRGRIVPKYEITSQTGVKITTPIKDAEGKEYFRAEIDGKYTVKIIATDGNMSTSIELYVYCGDIVPPTIIINDTVKTTYKKGDKFSFNAFDSITDNASATGSNFADFIIVKELLGPNGERVAHSTSAGSTDSATLDSVGTYTLIYTAEDKAGNVARMEYTITVTGTSSRASIPLQTLSTVLIIAAALLLVGVVIYVIRYRRVKVQN